MAELLLKNVGYLVTCDDEDRILRYVDVLVKDGVIVRISRGEMPGQEECAQEVIDASDMVMYPGLVNTHHHLYQTFSRNLPHVQNMELFPWLKTLYEIWKYLDEQVVYYSSLTGMGELLKTGCTTCLDHHYVFPKGMDQNLMDAQFAAADALGMRFHATRGSMDLSVKDGGLPPDSVVQTVDEILRSSEKTVNRYHDPSPYAMHQVALAPCSPFSVSADLLRESAALARSLGVHLHTHLAETKDEEAYTKEHFHMRPLEYMESLGWIGPDVWYAHGIHFTDEELKLLAQTKTGVAHCPISNMKLSSGIAKIPQMLELGVKVGLAVDGSASNDGSSLLEEMRAAYLLHRLNSSNAAPGGYDILKMATRGSAAILGREELGHIAPGMAADFFLIRQSRLALVGTAMDVGAVLATVGFRGNVDLTVVNGKVVVRDGRLTGLDEEKTACEANQVWEQYLRRA